MKILVTGGAGYIGTELINALNLVPQVEKIIAYDNLSRGNYNLFLDKNFYGTKLEFVNGDVLDSRLLRKTLSGVDVVYHLAAKVTTPFANIDSHFFEQTNHWGTAELVNVCENSGVKKFIFAGSTSVYGSSDHVAAAEETMPSPRSYYGFSKLRAEEQVKRLSNKMQAIILRCANVYGYSMSMRFDGVINRFMFEANFNKRISINGNGKQIRPFIHINKVKKTLAGLLSSNIPSGVYNLSASNLSVLEIVDTVKKVYPETETIFINHHVRMEDLQVSPPNKIEEYIPVGPSELYAELNDFRDQFSFYSGKEKTS